ncbi:hypothetical protein J4E83_008298 [Alternaria metachromatica]|uniref:uncharacterized protein n=1 Tax=Alternaria metachromatica TaxID=283354 RepID=UPI0020C3EB46|nr:uncharacterized protein J4E83_008298 [Alternaria metachromatica]KAI4610684.1 hypothetical protein J4E83_008298 [Alternaria metachromatica]
MPSTQNTAMMDVSTMAAHHGYSAHAPLSPTQLPGPIASYAGSSRWINAVATMTPEPKKRAKV